MKADGTADDSKRTREDLRREAESHGHRKRPVLRAVRENCVQCMGGVERYVRDCEITNCPMWPYRMGKNPFSDRTGNPTAFKKGHFIVPEE